MQQAHKQFNAFNKARPRSVEIRIAVDGVLGLLRGIVLLPERVLRGSRAI